jgi:hypothetical protein
MWLSGDCENTTLMLDIDNARRAYPRDSVKEFMARTIFTAFPSYIEEDVSKWTYLELVRKFVIAENLLLTRIPDYKPLDLRKITTGSGKKTPADSKELAKENQELDQAMGQRAHPLDMTPDEFASIGKKRISPNMARRLDKRRRG